MKLLIVLVLIQFNDIICYQPSYGINSFMHLKTNNPECVKRLNEFSDYHKNFIQCAVEYGQPIKICETCLNKFVMSNIYYKQLTENYNGTNCYDHYIDLDRINIVSSIYNDGLNIWNKAYCKDCYDWRDNTLNLNYSMETQTVLNHLNSTRQCIKEKNGDVCVHCLQKYTLLNNLFISMEKQKKSQICFDLQDAMNQTRLLWSKELKCCEERESSLVNFTILSCVFSTIVVLFYIAVPYSEIRSQSYRLPTNQSIEENRQSGPSNVTTNGNIITGFVMPSPASNKINDWNEDSSDEEIIDIHT